MNDSDVGYTFEWESEFLEWVSNKSNTLQIESELLDNYPEIKKIYSENFVLSTFLEENN